MCKAYLRKDSRVHATSLVQIYDEPSNRCVEVGETDGVVPWCWTILEDGTQTGPPSNGLL